MRTLRPPAPRFRPRLRLAAGALAVALAASVVPAPALGQQAANPDDKAERRIAEAREATLELEPDAPPSPDDPFAAVVEADQAALDAATVRLAAVAASDEADAALFTAATALNAAKKRTAAATKRRDDTRNELTLERDRLSDLTVRAYVTGGEVSLDEYRALVKGDTTDPAAGRAVMFDQVLQRQEEVTAEARKDASTARKALVAARTKQKAAQDEANARTEVAADRARDEADAIAAHEEAAADAARARARLSRSPAGLVPEGVSLIGMPRLNAGDLAGWFRTTSYRPRVSTPIEDYARWFIDEGRAEGIRGDIAFAQAVLETGGFANDDTVNANNFSGIGHCDTCASGWRFPSPEMGVRAQIQLLKSYAVRKPEYAHDLVDRRLRGPAGCCPTWGDL
ncbi:MAG: glucosaminidase domain-containing protein, partial [Actinobacteria bacterium]|nr:glucosaminidase domain-containing protein [Actinomycetota bacterium]